MDLHGLPKRKKRVTKSKRLGRGYGSGVGGHTVGRGMKGQKSRSGHKSMVMFEGGNTPFYKRMPKSRGFKRPGKIVNEAINVTVLDEAFKAKEVVSMESLKEKGLVRKRTERVKILGYGEIKKSVVVEGLAVSETAREKILAAKGKVQ